MPSPNPFISVLGVGIGLLLSWAGWGALFLSLLRIGNRSLGFSMCLGISISLLFGASYLAVFSTPPQLAWTIWIQSGDALFILQIIKKMRTGDWRKKIDSLHFGTVVGAGLLVIGVLAFSVIDVSNPPLNIFDDLLAYMPQVRMILDRGNLIDPFSLRRLASYGGQQILQSYYVLDAPIWTIGLFEKMLCMVIYLLLVWEAFGNALFWRAPLVVFAFLFSAVPRINTAPEISGATLVLGIYLQSRRLIDHGGRDLLRDLRELTVLLVLAGACLYLRANYVIGVGIILLSTLLNLPVSKKLKLVLALLSMLGLLLLLAPGSLMLYFSSNTPFFPLFHGNFVEGYNTFQNSQSRTGIPLPFIWRSILESRLDLLFKITVCAFIIFKSCKWSILSTFIASSVTVIAMVFGIAGTQDSNSVYRYSFPFLILVQIVAYAQWSSLPIPRIKGASAYDLIKIPAYWFLAFSFIAFLAESTHNAAIFYSDYSKKLMGAWGRPLINDPYKHIRDSYAHVQESIPEGANVVSIVEHPFLFDLARNRVWSVDIPGNVSPEHGLDFHDFPSKIDDYFRKVGIDYLVFQEPASAQGQYSLEFWTSWSKRTIRLKDFHSEWIPHYFDLVRYLTSKETSTGIILKYGDYYVYKFTL